MKRGRNTPVDKAGKEPLASARKMIKDVTTALQQDQLFPRVFFLDHEARVHRRGIRFFLKKDEATDCSRENGNLPVWSIDKTSDGGAKYFVVASYDSFWDVYESSSRPKYGSSVFAPDRVWEEYDQPPPSGSSRKDLELMRHNILKKAFQILPFAYEVVLEGVPLHLYLDLEASRETNPELDAESLVLDLLGELKSFMCGMYLGIGDHVLRNPRLVVFDSSTTRKFSKHIIFKLDGVLFANNYICGALMRNFHLHLIERFGPPNSNRFYVHPEQSATSRNKVCILDFAVYTKNRDFRIIGSCKRKGCNTSKTLLRWLWVEGSPGQLTKQLFLDGLIQNSSGEDSVSIHLHRVVDTINGGIPGSSSLRTPQPLTLASGPSRNGTGAKGVIRFKRETVRSNGGLEFPRALENRLESLGVKVANWLSRCREQPFVDYFRAKERIKKVTLRKLRDGNYAWGIQTTSSYCTIRRSKMGSANHKAGRSGRKANFLIWITGLCNGGIYDENKEGRVKQMCIANTCTDGIGASKPAWSGWLGQGISRQLKQNIRGLIEEHVKTEVERLELIHLKDNSQCMFTDNLE